MLPYIISLFFSLLIMHFAIKAKNHLVKYLLHLFAVTPSVFLLTFRSDLCGTDTPNYIRLFDYLNSASLQQYISEVRYEPLFAILTFSLKKLGLSIECFFLVSALLTIIPVYIGSIKLRKFVSPLIPMALFYLMFYQYSFNIVRQSIAMSICFLGYVYLVIEGKSIISFLLGVTAVLFHTVSIVYIFIFFIFQFLGRMSFKFLLINASLIIVLIYLYPLFFSDRVEYLEGYLSYSSGVSTQLSYLVEMTLNFLTVIIFYKKDKIGLRRYFMIVSGIGAIVIAFSSIGHYAFRVANCIDIMALLYVPLALKNAGSRIYYFFYLIFAVFFWWFVFIFNNSGGSYPYILSPTFNYF